MKKTVFDRPNVFLGLILLLIGVLLIVVLFGWPTWMGDSWKRLMAWGLFLVTIITLHVVWPRTTTELEDTRQAASDSGRRDATESEPPRADKKVDVLLAEYQAANGNRDHYDSVRWTIGSIFIAASLILLGYSFESHVVANPMYVWFLSAFSISVFWIWVLYDQAIEPVVMKSIETCWGVEDRLREIVPDCDIWLHKSIKKMDELKGRLRPFWIVRCLIVVVTAVWVVRMLLPLFLQAS